MVRRGSREVFHSAVDGCSKTGEELVHLGVHVLLSSLVPVVFITSYSITPSVVAAGFSESQQKAYDAFVQYGVQTPRSQETPDRGAGRARQQQDIEKSRISMALELFTRAEENQKEGRYIDALEGYQGVIEGYPDLALAERARVKRALMEYQVGKVRDCILHLEDEEVAVRGNAEVHAALAAVLYSERPRELDIAEEQWDIATEFDTRYSSIEFVENSRYWPPAMVSALRKFLLLQHS